MEKIDVSSFNDISETLLITLACKAVETKRSDGIFHDPKALQITEMINYDLTKYYQLKNNVISVCHRAQKIDAYCTQFMNLHPEAVIVSLASGLDTRFLRIDNGSVYFYELDLPEVIAVRQQFLPTSTRNIYLPYSAWDFRWMDELLSHQQKPVLFIAEGFAMYQTGENMRLLIQEILERFKHPASEIIFDICSTYHQNRAHKHPAVGQTKARFLWGIDHYQEIEKWHPRLKLASVYYYARPFFQRLGWYNLMRLVPRIGKGYAILRFKLSG